MSTTYGATGSGQRAASVRRISSFIRGCWDAFQQRRKREKLRVDLRDLTDWELKDIGVSRGQIEYLASNGGVDPGSIRSAE
jgi:uncharacterized protein YjiS (DUF1127 family)